MQFFIDVLGFQRLGNPNDLGSQLMPMLSLPSPDDKTYQAFAILGHSCGLQLVIAEQDDLTEAGKSFDTDAVYRRFPLAFKVSNLKDAIDKLRQYPDIHINHQSLKEQRRYIYFTTFWGMYIQLIESDDKDVVAQTALF